MRKKVGEIETGVVWFKNKRCKSSTQKENERQVRRIAAKLNQPMRDGDEEIYVLTNLPRKVPARKIAQLYRACWRIESAFQEMAEHLQGKVNALGYPKAALFSFCMALLSYNILNVSKAAVSAAHGEESADALSTHHIADDISATYRGMMIVITASFWTNDFATLSPAKMTQELTDIAKHINLKRYRKNP